MDIIIGFIIIIVIAVILRLFDFIRKGNPISEYNKMDSFNKNNEFLFVSYGFIVSIYQANGKSPSKKKELMEMIYRFAEKQLSFSEFKNHEKKAHWKNGIFSIYIKKITISKKML